MDVRYAHHYEDAKKYDTETIRRHYLVENLFQMGKVNMTYSHYDRIVIAGIMPTNSPLVLEAGKELACDYFLQRREMGVINIGETGIVSVDGTEHELKYKDCLFVGMGAKDVRFKSLNTNKPAKFYMASGPAHKSYPNVKIDIDKANKLSIGNAEEGNKRTINQLIHPAVLQSCQLSMGLTELESGSLWNTMPSHTHDRRMEVYLYFNMDENNAVFHMMGQPQETRHIVVKNEEAVISPSWSIHSGVGTKNYSFIWAMVGENQTFDDMDGVKTVDLR